MRSIGSERVGRGCKWLRAWSVLCVLIAELVPSMALGQTLQEIEAMRTYVQQQGLNGFREAIAANDWQAPRIPSKWHLENIAGADASIGDPARSLGLAVVEKTDEWAPLMESENGQELLDRATRLVDLAHWIGNVEGYGNILAATHACDVALTGLACLVANLSFPLPGVVEQVERCDLPIQTLAARARILNGEVGAVLLPTNPASYRELEEPWSLRKGRAALRDATEEENQSRLFKVLRQALEAAGLDPDQPEPYASFVEDEPCDSPQTTSNCWEKKEHGGILVGPSSADTRIDAVRRLITFRQAVGAFPTSPQRPTQVFPDVMDAFDEAWEPHSTSETFNLGGDAALTYEAILAGGYADADTVKRRLHHPTGSASDGTPTAGAEVTPSP